MLNPNALRLSKHIAAAALLGLIATDFGAPATAQTRPPSQADYATNNFDRSDELKVTGQIDRVETVDGDTIVWVVASKVLKQGARVQPGTEGLGKGRMWRVEGPGLKDIKVKDLPKLAAGTDIVISGYNSDDKTCEPTCRISSRKIKLD